MPDEFEAVKSYCDKLAGRYSARDAMLEEIRQMLHMEWSEYPGGDWIKPTMSPGAFNAVMGAVRLMTATEPQISVPFDEVGGLEKTISDNIEKAAKAMWNGSGRIAQRPVHYEIVFSALLFGEVCASVTRLEDLAAYAKGAEDKGMAARIEAAQLESPYLFQVYNPATCYGDFDALGLRGMLRRVETTWGQVVDVWGKLAEDALGSVAKDRTDTVTLNDWYDWERRAVWVEEANEPILFDEHNLGFLPVVDMIVDGTMLFEEPERQRFPLLYPVWKSGLWKRENLSMTTVYSLIHVLASNPLLKRKTPQPDSKLEIDRTVPGGVVSLLPDEDITPLVEKVVDPSQWQGLEMAQRINRESTIPPMTLGMSPDNVMSFSAISLLSQSGRLPLVGTKQISGAAIANLLRIAFKWQKNQGGKTAKFYDGNKKGIELKTSDIPDRVALIVNLEPDVPTDKLQMANVAQMVVGAGLASKRWARENVLQVGQSQEMDQEIYDERSVEAISQQRIMAVVQQMQMQLQAAQQQGQIPPGGQALNEAAGAPGAAPQQAPQAPRQPIAPNPSVMEMSGAMPPGGQIGPGMPMPGPAPSRLEQG